MKEQNNDAKVVASVPNGRKNLKIGKPRKIVAAAMQSKVAYCGAGGFAGGGGSSFGGGSSMGFGGNYYSPELSPDFLELPQSLDEQRNYYRFFYRTDPFVGQAIDLHTEIPLSKIRLSMPKAKNRPIAEASLRFCEKWVERIGLLQRMLEIVHEYYLLGEVFIFVEDTNPLMPREIIEDKVDKLDEETGEIEEEWHEREDANERAYRWLRKNYKGWTALRVLPPEQIHMESVPFTDEKIIELIPDSKSKNIVEKAANGDPTAQRIVDSMPSVIVEHIRAGRNIPLNTDPVMGSFLYYLCRKKSQYEPRGHSILERCIRILVYRDKLRQAQTSIASRHMTPFRIVYGEDLNEEDVANLREQVDLALQDPDYSIIANFEVRWEEMGAERRLLELGSEYDLTDRQMYAGLGVTESLLSGESSYSGDRINLEVINIRYMLLRELLQSFMEQQILKPMCEIMGFVEEDEDGEEVVIFPRLSFTRLALRDNQDTFDALFNLYQKGSLDVDAILEILNIDPVATKEKLERDRWTVNDSSFNELFRSIYSRVGDSLSENSDVAEILAANLGLRYEKPEQGGGRF